MDTKNLRRKTLPSRKKNLGKKIVRCDEISKNFSTYKKTEVENRELDKVTREKSSQPRKEQEKKTGGRDGQQMPARKNQLRVVTQYILDSILYC